MKVDEKTKQKRQPQIEKLLRYLKKEGIEYAGEDEFHNVIFKNSKKEKRISGEEFYRVSGICSYKKDIEGTTFFALLPMDDAMFYCSYLYTLLMFVFYPPKPKL